VSFVLDSSAAIAWLLREADHDRADALIRGLGEGAAIAPALIFLEMANAMISAERQKRIDRAECEALIRLAARMPLQTVEFGPSILAPLGSLCLDHGLTTYDAAYLLLALREGLPLATLDRRLALAARARGVALALPLV